MPLLRRQPFIKEPLPKDLDPDEELFHCTLTNEVFRDYDLLWTCEMTGRPGLTYLEATEIEGKARAALSAMPRPLKRTMLFLACCSRRQRLKDLRDDVMGYMRERFFTGEEVDAVVNGERTLCQVVKVIAPHSAENDHNSHRSSDDSDDEVELEFDPSEFQYQVRVVGSSKGTVHIVTAADLMRRKGVITRDKCKLFLKQACTLIKGTYQAREKFVEKYGLVQTKFGDIFAGPLPRFDGQSGDSAVNLKLAMSGGGSGKKRKREGSSGERSSPSKKKKKKKKSTSSSKERAISAKEEEKQKIEEERRLKKEEKDKEREQKRAERRLLADCLREWQKPRDDLECDDLLDLPTPVPVTTALPNEIFGDVLALLEFVHDFSEFLSVKDHFPQGVTMDIVENALVECEVRGPLSNLLQMLLSSVFNVFGEGEGGEGRGSGGAVIDGIGLDRGHKDDDAAAAGSSVVDVDLRTAVAAANLPLQVHGISLHKIGLDAFTLTEVLRLHLLSSGIRSGSSAAYVNRDDPARKFRLDEADLLESLKSKLVFDLVPGAKLKILMCLVGQLLTCDAIREDVEENIERLRLIKYEFRMFQWAEQRREREEAALRLRKKMEKEEGALANGDGIEKQPAPGADDEGYDDDVELDRQEAKRRHEGSKREREFVDQINKLQGRGVVQPLGQDRAHRRYWMFNATPGLFVEDDDDDTMGPCLPRSTPNPNSNPFVSFNHSMSDARLRQSDKENAAAAALLLESSTNGVVVGKAQKLLGDNRTNGAVNGVDGLRAARAARVSSQDSLPAGEKKSSSGQVFGMCNALGDQCQVHGSVRRRRAKWSFFASAAHVESLIAGLNPRGFREGNLKETLVAEKKRVLLSVAKCPVARLNPEANVAMATVAATAQDESVAEETTEARKSNRILTTTTVLPSTVSTATAVEEDTLMADGVSCRLTGNKAHRCQDFLDLTLRDSLLEIEEKIYAGGLGSIKVGDRTEWRERIGSYDPDKIPVEERNPTAVAKEVAEILLLIYSGIESKYLTSPLGSSGGGNDSERNGNKPLTARWLNSLAACTSLPQVFVHLATLERSVAWSRSVLNARCRICRRKGDAEHMLLCDECDRGHHMYCLRPPLQDVPEGEWLCKECCPRPKLNPRKRTVQFIEEKEEEEDEDEESDEDDDEEVEVEDDEAKTVAINRGVGRSTRLRQKLPVCNACHKNGELISCSECDVSYHSTCTLPPLRRVPRGKWTCTECSDARTASATAPPSPPPAAEQAEKTLSRTRSKQQQVTVNTRPKRTATVVAEVQVPRRSERSVKRVLDYSKHTRDSSDEEESTAATTAATNKLSRRINRTAQDDVPDDEWYGLVRRSMPSVNRRGASDDVPLDFRACDRLLTDLVRHEQAWPFLRPVTRKEVATYYEIVKRPVDFGAIRSRLNGMTYKTNKAFVADVLLVFQNCCVINPATGPEYRAAEILGRFFLSRVRECGLGLRAEPEGTTTTSSAGTSRSSSRKASPIEAVAATEETTRNASESDADVEVDRLVEEAIVVVDDVDISGGGGDDEDLQQTNEVTASAGDVATTSSAGDVAATSSAGDVDPTSLAGDVAATSSAGDVDATSSAGDVDPTSLAGDVVATSSTGDVVATSSTGDVYATSSTCDVAAISSTGDVDATSSTSDVDTTLLAGDVAATSSTGDVAAISSTGDVDATSSAGDVDATSLAGDVDATSLTGDVDATSLAGDVDVMPTSGVVDVMPISGDVDVMPTPSDVSLTPTAFDVDVTPTMGDVEVMTPAGDVISTMYADVVDVAPAASDVDLAPTVGDVELKVTIGDVDMTPSASGVEGAVST